ncbi:hypothetical protein PCANC_13972 [Puccinia coronata f. sp. avenae]|uniref:Uncharacterized protein n=1 Tax=Puccinia coronata f. sp. avenae TaxID=200324 RepID=A0A2N5SL30_9BASI|nr:hypothetical protein PCANC_13972 [Puccinia coronata f. sp. avenae]
MEAGTTIVADAANAGKDGTDVGEVTLGGSRGLESTNDIERTRFSLWSKPSAEERKELHLDQQLPNQGTWKEVILQWYNSLKYALSKIRKIFRNKFPKHEVEVPHNKLSPQNPGLSELVMDDKSIVEKGDGSKNTIPINDIAEEIPLARQDVADKLQASLHELQSHKDEVHEVDIPYDNLFRRNPDLSELVMDDELIDERVDGFMKAQWQAEEFQLTYQFRAKNLKESLHRLHTLQKETLMDSNPMWDADKTFSAKIRPMLLNWESDGNSEPKQILGKSLAAYRSKSIAANQKFLAQTLPKDQQYMGAFLGQMGPDKVLKPWFQAFIKEEWHPRN